ncbi:MAG TPA: ABC transporter permease subunit [Tepidisphaeraceae bacterium]
MAMARLIWKEWREQRWRIGFGCVILCAFALIGLRTRAVDDQSILIGTCAIGVLLLPILAAAGLVPAERDEGTLRMLLAMPVKPWKVLAAKTLLGAALCAVPLMAAAIVSVAVARGREVSIPATLAIYGGSIATALLLFVWMLAFTARSEGEGRAAGLAVGVLVFWLMATYGLLNVVQREESRISHLPHPAPSTRAELLLAPTPFVAVFAADGIALATGMAVQLGIAAGLWFWAAHAVAAHESEGRP